MVQRGTTPENDMFGGMRAVEGRSRRETVKQKTKRRIDSLDEGIQMSNLNRNKTMAINKDPIDRTITPDLL